MNVAGYVVWLALAGAIFAQTPTATAVGETIVTLKGDRFEKARVTNVTPATLTITHSVGVATLPFTDFSDDIQKRFEYDPAKAKGYLQQLAVEFQRRYEMQIAQQQAAEKKAKDESYWKARRSAENAEAVSRLAHFFHDGGDFIYDPATKRVYFSEAEAATAREAALRMVKEAQPR
jgi:hypothetical protein